MAWRAMGCIAASIAVSGGGVSSSSRSMRHVESHSKRGLKYKLPAEETLSCQLLEIVFSSVEEMEQKRINGTDYKYLFPMVMIAMKSLSRGADRLRTSTSAMVKLLDNLMELIEGMGGDWVSHKLQMLLGTIKRLLIWLHSFELRRKKTLYYMLFLHLH